MVFSTHQEQTVGKGDKISIVVKFEVKRNGRLTTAIASCLL